MPTGLIEGIKPLTSYKCTGNRASGHALVGWRVSAYFRNSASDQTWHEGLVVDFNGVDHVVFHAIDHYHESWTLPDDELCYHKPQAAGSHRKRVTQQMQQSLDMDV